MGFNFVATNAEIDAVFNDFDTGGDGTIHYKELNKMLRQGFNLDPSLRPGAAGEIGTKATNKATLRRNQPGGKRGAALSTAVRVDPDSDVPIAAQLRDILTANAVRVIDLFRQVRSRHAPPPRATRVTAARQRAVPPPRATAA